MNPVTDALTVADEHAEQDYANGYVSAVEVIARMQAARAQVVELSDEDLLTAAGLLNAEYRPSPAEAFILAFVESGK